MSSFEEELPAAASPERIEAAVDEVAAFLRTGASTGYERVDLKARMISDVAESDAFESMADGSTSAATVDEPRLFELLRELREAFYDPDDDGTWISMRLYAVPDGGRWLTVNHFWEPDWRVAPPDEKYREDLERYPRPYSETPDWLSAKVGQS
ncbi:hypothetical protein [Actinospica robiniae]|uniref:hypothetical protein n=1 Tax=Actinospica robiniae TaxID=304901 RepID=UPI000417E376|nr:hypothetical protein [Actinospica robiniae]